MRASFGSADLYKALDHFKLWGIKLDFGPNLPCIPRNAVLHETASLYRQVFWALRMDAALCNEYEMLEGDWLPSP